MRKLMRCLWAGGVVLGLSGCQSAAPVKAEGPAQTVDARPEPGTPAPSSPEASASTAPESQGDSPAVTAPWRASTSDEAGLCAMELPSLSVEGCELSGPWRGELGTVLTPEVAHDAMTDALEACAAHEDCGGVSTKFNNAAPWVLLGKGSGSWRLDSDSYGCTVFLRCPVHGAN